MNVIFLKVVHVTSKQSCYFKIRNIKKLREVYRSPLEKCKDKNQKLAEIINYVLKQVLI